MLCHSSVHGFYIMIHSFCYISILFHNDLFVCVKKKRTGMACALCYVFSRLRAP